MELLRFPLADGDNAESLLGRVCLVITQLPIEYFPNHFHWHLCFHEKAKNGKEVFFLSSLQAHK